jgi:hypothetical protein
VSGGIAKQIREWSADTLNVAIDRVTHVDLGVNFKSQIARMKFGNHCMSIGSKGSFTLRCRISASEPSTCEIHHVIDEQRHADDAAVHQVGDVRCGLNRIYPHGPPNLSIARS